MLTTYSAKAFIAAITVIAVFSSAMSFVYPDIRVVPVAEASPALEASTSTPFFPPIPQRLSSPVRVSIPSAGISAPIIPVGVTAKGQLDTPHNYVQAGWYSLGPKPGEMGSAVIDGHVDNGGKTPGPFKNLRVAKVGDTVKIDTATGGALFFVITSMDVYKTAAFPAEKVFRDADGAVIKIITCHGKFVSSKGTYDERLVVTAKLIPQAN